MDMLRRTVKMLMVITVTLLFSGCASYSITEKDMTDYLQETVELDQSVGIEEVMYARVSVDDLNVKIGRKAQDRVSVFANTQAEVKVATLEKMGVELELEFSAIPSYDPESGEVFLKSLRLERFDEQGYQLTPEVKQLIKPAVSMIGYALSQQPVYKLDSAKVQQALLKSAEPNLVIKDNKLVIELFD